MVFCWVCDLCGNTQDTRTAMWLICPCGGDMRRDYKAEGVNLDLSALRSKDGR